MGIFTIIKQYLNIIIGVLVSVITFYLASLYYNGKIDKINNEYNNYKVTTEKNIQEQKISILTQTNKIKEENEQLNNKLKEVENENYKNYTELQKSNNTIKSSVANGSNRLYINAECSKPTNSTDTKTENNTTITVDDGKTTKAVIDPRDGQSIISITEKADKYKSQLEALQDWVNVLILDNNK
jgi:hypothetical protein